jgi:hypothetical protein
MKRERKDERDIMKSAKKESESPPKTIRKGDPFLDRRSGEEQRAIHSLDYFQEGNPCRRSGADRRTNVERRDGYVRISEWGSVCVVNEDKELNDGNMDIKI